MINLFTTVLLSHTFIVACFHLTSFKPIQNALDTLVSNVSYSHVHIYLLSTRSSLLFFRF